MMDKEYEFDEFVSGNPKKETSGDNYLSVEETEELYDHEGKKVSFEGTIAMVPWQHLIHLPEACRTINYINRGKDQVVVYTKEAVECKTKVEVKGTVVKIQGKSKRPGSDEVFTEYQVIADSWRCIQYGK